MTLTKIQLRIRAWQTRVSIRSIFMPVARLNRAERTRFELTQSASKHNQHRIDELPMRGIASFFAQQVNDIFSRFIHLDRIIEVVEKIERLGDFEQPDLAQQLLH